MKNIIFILLVLLSVACTNQQKDQKSQNENEAVLSRHSWSLEKLWESDTLLRTCESVRFDKERKHLFVTCINGAPWEKDGKGFIALLNLDGSIKSESWVTGLDAPKGMGIMDDLLYVADMNHIVVIDIENATIKKRIEIPGAAQLNDIDIDSKGKVYFTDSETGWIWTMVDDHPEQWIEGNFKRPNGLFIEDERILLASSMSQDLTAIDLEDNSPEVICTEIGHGDGIEFTGIEGHYIVTSWAGEIFLILPDYTKVSLLNTSDIKINSADIGFNLNEQIVYVPTFFDNRVMAYRLEESAEPERSGAR
jgi:sugar lactone lactonase YvrE